MFPGLPDVVVLRSLKPCVRSICACHAASSDRAGATLPTPLDDDVPQDADLDAKFDVFDDDDLDAPLGDEDANAVLDVIDHDGTLEHALGTPVGVPSHLPLALPARVVAVRGRLAFGVIGEMRIPVNLALTLSLRQLSLRLPPRPARPLARVPHPGEGTAKVRGRCALGHELRRGGSCEHDRGKNTPVHSVAICFAF